MYNRVKFLFFFYRNVLWSVIKVKRRLITAVMAASVLFSFAACDLFNGLTNKQTEITTEAETTTSEATTTTEETAESKKPTKIPTKPTYIPKGWYKDEDAWGIKHKGKKCYVITFGGSAKGWYKGKWVKLYEVQDTYDDEGNYIVTYYRDKKHKKVYCSYDMAP